MNNINILKRTSGRPLQFRKVTLPSNLNFRCDVCCTTSARTGGAGNEHLQVCVQFSQIRTGINKYKIKATSFQYMCAKCADELVVLSKQGNAAK